MAQLEEKYTNEMCKMTEKEIKRRGPGTKAAAAAAAQRSRGIVMVKAAAVQRS